MGAVYLICGYYSKQIESRISNYNQRLAELKDEIMKSEQAFFDQLP